MKFVPLIFRVVPAIEIRNVALSSARSVSFPFLSFALPIFAFEDKPTRDVSVFRSARKKRHDYKFSRSRGAEITYSGALFFTAGGSFFFFTFESSILEYNFKTSTDRGAAYQHLNYLRLKVYKRRTDHEYRSYIAPLFRAQSDDQAT